jgi:hypothetical protein
MYSKLYSENRAVYEIMTKHMGKQEATNDVTVWRIRVACWISKTTRTHARAFTRPRSLAPLHTHTRERAHTHTEICVILIAFPQ